MAPHVAAIKAQARCTDSGVIFPLKWRVFYPDVIICEGLCACGTIFVCLFMCDLFAWSWACTWNAVCSIQSLSMYFFFCILDGVFVFGLQSSSAGLWNHPGLQHASGLSPAHRRGDRRHSALHCPRPSNLTSTQHTILCHHCTQIYRWAVNYVYLCILRSHLCISTHWLSGKTDPLNNTSKVNVQSLMECWNFPQKRDFCFLE